VDGTLPKRKMLDGYLDIDLRETIARNERHENLLAQQTEIVQRESFLEKMADNLTSLIEERNRLVECFELEIGRQAQRIDRERKSIDEYHNKLNAAREALLITKHNAALALQNEEIADLVESSVLGTE
jgi:hypothetical protein